MENIDYIKKLSRYKGQKLDARQLEKNILGNQARSKKKSSSSLDFEGFLKEMLSLGLIKKGNKSYSVASPFAVTGVLSISRRGTAFASVNMEKDIMIPERHRKSARDKDEVLVEITNHGNRGYEGKVIKVTRPFTDKFLVRVESRKNTSYLVTLVDSTDKEYGVVVSKKGLKQNGLFFVKLTNEKSRFTIPGSDSRKPSVRTLPLFNIVGICNEKDSTVDLNRICVKHALPMHYDKQLAPSKNELDRITSQGFNEKDRKNFTKDYTFTIDGEEAKDFDDAISFKKNFKGYELTVHIADVSHYVVPGSKLDTEALARGNSYYLQKAVLPMLPEILSEEYCSLKPHTKRLAFSCQMKFNRKGIITGYEFHKSIIYIDQRYTYNQAEKILDDKKSRLFDIYQFIKILKKQRQKEGRVELVIPEYKPQLDENGDIIGIESRDRLNSSILIEECMISANICAAHISKQKNFPLLHRVHNEIADDSVVRLNEFLKLFGFKIQLKDVSHKSINRALEALKGTRSEPVFNSLLLRTFSQARYTPEEQGHWGLALNDYAHFTSPIRRYADLVVHRQIAAHIRKQKSLYSIEELFSIGVHISRRERIALEAERDMQKLLTIRLLAQYNDLETEAFLTGFNKSGLFIALLEPPIEGFVPVSAFSRENSVSSLDEFRVILSRYQKTVSIGTRFQVKLVKADWYQAQAVFEIVKVLKH